MPVPGSLSWSCFGQRQRSRTTPMSSHPKHGLIDAEDDASSGRVSTVSQPDSDSRWSSMSCPDLSGETVAWIAGQLPGVSEDALSDEATAPHAAEPAPSHSSTTGRGPRHDSSAATEPESSTVSPTVMVGGDATRTTVGDTPAPAVLDAATARSTHAVRSAIGRVRAGCRASFLRAGTGTDCAPARPRAQGWIRFVLPILELAMFVPRGRVTIG